MRSTDRGSTTSATSCWTSVTTWATRGAGEVVELLVRERLERRRVGDALAGGERHLDGELGDERLPRAGGRRHDDGLSGLDRPDRFELEVVERERVPCAKLLEQLHHRTQYHGDRKSVV